MELTIMEVIMVLLWTCLTNAPYLTKNIWFNKFFTSLDFITALAMESSLEFAPIH
ncbi:carbamoyl-phosphate synthase (glutamine-hydrolyzing) cpa2 [Fusarium poae]